MQQKYLILQDIYSKRTHEGQKEKQQMHNDPNKLAQKDSIEKQLTSGFSDFPTFTVFFCQFSPKAHNTQ